jgi:hypothetical protein
MIAAKFQEVFTCFLAGPGDHGRHGKRARPGSGTAQFSCATLAISGIINLVKAATHPFKHPGRHELLASLPSLL